MTNREQPFHWFEIRLMISYTTAWLHRSPKGDNFSTYKNEVSGSIKRYSVKEYEGNNPKQGGGNSNIFYFHLYLGTWSNLTIIFFSWVETTNMCSWLFDLFGRKVEFSRVYKASAWCCLKTESLCLMNFCCIFWRVWNPILWTRKWNPPSKWSRVLTSKTHKFHTNSLRKQFPPLRVPPPKEKHQTDTKKCKSYPPSSTLPSPWAHRHVFLVCR